MVGGKSLALGLALLALSGCATTRGAEEDDDDLEIETIVSSSVRIERRKKLPAIAHVERECDVGEVRRVIDLLGARGARRVNLKVENGPQAEVNTHLVPKGRWLVVAMNDSGFKLFVSTSDALKPKEAPQVPEGEETSEVPLRGGQPDWERFINLVRALASKQSNLVGASLVASASGPAERAIEALQQIRIALPDPQRRYLLAF